MRTSWLTVLVLAVTACGGRIPSEDADPRAADPAADPASSPARPFAGSVSASASSSSSSGAASAPVTAGAATSAPACACGMVTVHCSTKVGYASADQSRCTIDVSARTCAELGLADGARVSPTTILEAPLPAITSANHLYDVCATKHEARHTCDPIRTTRYCQTEQNAYAVSRDCFEQYLATSCGSKDAPRFCDRVQSFVDGSQAALELNTCLCASGTTCSSCRASCRDAWSSVASTCNDAARAYCAVNGK